MNNLTIAIILIAVAQALTIILTLGREREIRRLRELVTEHRIQVAEVKAWLAGRMQSAQPRRIRSDREPVADEMRVPEPVTTPKDLPEPVRPGAAEDELNRATKPFKWFKEDADEVRGIVAGLKGDAPPEPATAPDTIHPSTAEDELKRAAKAKDWSREIVVGLQAGLQLQRGAPPLPTTTRAAEPATTPKDSADAKRPGTAEEELKRATKVINWLNEDADKARAIAAAQQANWTAPKAEEGGAEVDAPFLIRKT